jgi:DNA-binding transcriptional LysR family regulator
MELRHLRYFVAVAEELHFRRAAERVHIAQPAISEQIRNLERELGTQLLERTPRSVSLTPPGAVLLDEARRMLRLADDAQRLTRQAHTRQFSRLRIARPADVLPAAVPRALRRFAETNPDVDVSVEQLDPRAAIEDMRADLLDVVIVCLPAPLAGLNVTPIGEEQAVIALADTHPGVRQDAFPIEQLDGAAPILLPRQSNPPFYDGIISAAHAAGVTLTPTHTAAPTVEQALLAISTGRSVALLPSSVTARHTLPGLRFIPLAEPAPRCAVALATSGSVELLHASRFVRLVVAITRAQNSSPRRIASRAAA